jgi:MFS family permease
MALTVGRVTTTSDRRSEAVPASAGGAAATAGVLSRPYRPFTLGIVSCVLLIAFEATAVNTAMPVAARSLHGIGLYAFAFSAFFTTSLLAMVFSGEWCDKRGPLAPLATGILLFGAGLVIAGTAGRMWTFIGGRAVQGFGGGLVIVALYVVVGRAYPERLRASVFAAFSASWVVPSIVGPAISGTVTENLGWRWVFLAIPVLILLPAAVMVPPLRRLEREQGSGRPGGKRPGARMDRRRILLSLTVAVGAGLLQYAGQHLELLGLVPALAGAAIMVPAVLRILPRGTLRAGRGLPTVVLLRGVAAGTFFAAESFVPLMLVTERGLTPTLAGLSLAGGGASWAAGSWVQGRPRMEPHRPRLLQLGFCLIALAIAGAGTALLPGVPAWIVACAWVVGGAGMGTVISSLSVLLMAQSAPEETGTNSASLQTSDSLGNVLLVALAGVLFAALGGGAAATAVTASGASVAGSGGQHPLAFGVIFIVMACGAAVGAVLAPRATVHRT